MIFSCGSREGEMDRGKVLTKEAQLFLTSMEKDLMEKGIKAKEGLEKKSRGPLFLSNAYSKVRSRYLKAPMGSCHDLCKYGHKNEFDDEGKNTVFRRFMTNSIVCDVVQNHVSGLNVGDRRKSSGLKLKHFDKAKVLQPNMHSEGKEVGMTEIHDEISIKTPSEDHTSARSLLLEKKSIEFPLKIILQNSSADVVNPMNGSNSNKKKKNQAVKPKASLVLEPSPVKEVKKRSSLASTETTLGGGPNILKEKAALYMKETITSSALDVNRQKKMTVRKLSGSSKLQSEKKNVSLPSKKIDGSAKPAISLKESVPLVRSVIQLNDTRRNLEGSRNLDRKVSKSSKMIEVGDRNLSKLQKASIFSTTPVHDAVSLKVRKFKNLKHATQERDEKSDDGDDIHVNIQEIIKTKSENEDMVANDENFSKEGEGYISESCISELSEIEEKQSCELSEEDEKRRVRRTPAIKRDNNSSLPYKMKFRRGRVIDLRPTENIGPKRLRFRRGRMLDESPNGEVVKRIFRKNKDDMKASGSVAHSNSSEASAVTLKHQDAQEKKNIQALFNHVIEETASKLVQTRKSKVKALVGAFETVISLQENKAAQLV